MLFGQGFTDLLAKTSGASGGAARTPPTTTVTNPSTLARIFRNAVVQASGSSQPAINIDDMVAAYQGVQESYQQQIYNAGPTGGQIVEPLSPEEFAQEELEENFAPQVQANSFAERAGDLLSKVAGVQF